MVISYKSLTSIPDINEDSDDCVSLVDPRTPDSTWVPSLRQLTVTVGLVIASTAMVATVLNGKSSTIRTDTGHLDAISQLSLTDPCANYARVKLEKPIHNNLAGKGPDKGAEGIVYPAENIHPGKPSESLLLVVNATSGNMDTDPAANGIYGKYARITAKGGTFLHTTFTLFKADTLEPAALQNLSITFFDLDTHDSKTAVEYVRLNGHHQYFLTDESNVDVTENGDGYITFKATVPGTWQDNPMDPLLLTPDQKRKAVTVEYHNVHQFHVEIGAEGTNGQRRWFNFVLRPSLRCARTVGCIKGVNCPDDPPVTPSPTTGSTTPPIISTTTTTAKRKCLFIFPIFNWCVPSFW